MRGGGPLERGATLLVTGVPFFRKTARKGKTSTKKHNHVMKRGEGKTN